MRLGQDTLGAKDTLSAGGKSFNYYSLDKAKSSLSGDISKLAYAHRILLENLLRFEDGNSVTTEDINSLVQVGLGQLDPIEIAYRPARVLMQDFTGVPAVVDLAAMRDAMSKLNASPDKINPQVPVDLVIDHSVMVDSYASSDAFKKNVELEFERNKERYVFLKWGQQSFDNFRVVPPGTGICHQVNLENLAKVVWDNEIDGETYLYPDTLVGTDSHTTMVNGLGVLGWGVGGIEAEAAMLGQPISMLIPQVIGFELTGRLPEGATATDLVLTVTQMLREKGVVGKFVEFYGSGLDGLTLADRATISNMAPEYGATSGLFPIDKETLRYLTFTGRDPELCQVVEAYAKAQGLWRDDSIQRHYQDTLKLELSEIQPSLAGPKRPQDKIALKAAKTTMSAVLASDNSQEGQSFAVDHYGYSIHNGDVVIAAITSCTNTSNPSVMLGAGLLAKKALAKGLKPKPWVKTSLAPGSQVVTDYLDKAGLTNALDELGFNLVGYGCTTCIGNSGPLDDHIARLVERYNVHVCSVLSGNRNFEGRINPHVKSNFLASPPLVVAYALAGSMLIDFAIEPIGQDKDGNDVYLKDIWPSSHEIAEAVSTCVTPEMFKQRYADVFKGDEQWQAMHTPPTQTYNWEEASTYVKNPPYFENLTATASSSGANVTGARILALLGDSITTDHISPAGSIKADGPAGLYLQERGVEPRLFNSFGARRGNHEIMMRGTFANIRLQNEMTPENNGGYTRMLPNADIIPIYDAAMRYKEAGTPLVVFAGKEYGTGSSRDWAAKGTKLLGVKAVITESFERIHRSNLVGMGVLPLVFKDGENRQSLRLKGDETIDLLGLDAGIVPQMDVTLKITRADGEITETKLLCRLDTEDEVSYFQNGGILSYVLRNLAGDGRNAISA